MRFFPNCSILEANEGTVGSYAWKSILSARDVVRKGMVWRVGNGHSVCIREDKWLPNQVCKTVMLPPPSFPLDAKVCNLIDPESAIWKVDQVQQLFTPFDAKLILSIPLNARLPPNHLIWSHTPMGVFTTRSAYKMLANSALVNNASSSNPNPQKKFWRGLWKLQVPNKVKVFAWRALRTMDTLIRRHVVDENLCPVCKIAAKDPFHMVLHCSEVEPVWREHGWFSQAFSSPPSDFTDLLSRFLQVTEDNRAELFICMAWSLWQRQNKLRIGLPSPPLNQVGPQAAKFLQDYLDTQDIQAPSNSMATSTQSWTPLNTNSFKANFDGAVFNSSNSAGVGVIICDNNGEVTAAMSECILLPNIVLEVEAMACRRAVTFALEIGIQDAVAMPLGGQGIP